MTEEQTKEVVAMPSAPPSEQINDAAVNNNDDDDFGAFSAFETATFTDDNNDDGPSGEDLVSKPPVADEPHMTEAVEAALNDDNIEFTEAPFEAATVIQIEANRPVDLFSSAVDTEMKPSNNIEAVELEGTGSVNNGVINTDPFSAFDALVDNTEGGGEQSSANPIFDQQPADVAGDEFGDFEGENGGSNNFDDAFSSNNNTGSTVDVTEPVMTEVANDEHVIPDENGAASNTFSAFDAFADVQDTPLPAFDGVKSEIVADPFSEASEVAQEVSEITTVETSDNDFGAFEENNGVETASIEDNLAFIPANGNEGVIKEGEKDGKVEKSSEEINVDIPEVDMEETPVDVSNAEPVGGNNDDLFGAFEETPPSQPLHETPAEVADNGSAAEILDEYTDVEEVKMSTTPFEELTEDAPTNQNNPDTHNNDFGFTPSESTIAVQEITTDELKGDSVEDEAPDESVADENDNFGAFTAPAEGNIETLAQAEHDVTVDNNETLVDDKPENDMAITDAEILQNDDFGDFEAPIVNETLVDVDTPLSAENTAAAMNTAEHSDDFGDFTAPKEAISSEQNVLAGDDTAFINDTYEESPAADNEEADFGEFSAPTGEDAASTTEMIETEIAVNVTESEGNEEFGDFDAPNQEELPVASAASLIEGEEPSGESAVEDNDDFRDFNASNDVPTVDPTQESDFGAFGEFAAPPMLDDNEETLAENDQPIETDFGTTEQGTEVSNEGIEDNDGFGDFSTHVEDAVVAENDATNVEKGDVSAPEKTAEVIDDFGDFSAPVEAESAINTSDAVENDDFGDFTAPAEQLSPPAEETVNETDEFGDFDGFSSPTMEAEATTEAIEGTDDDFGDFGEFSAPIETGDDTDTKEGAQESHKPVDTQDMQPTVEDDDDFGDFAAFEEAAPAEITDKHLPTQEVDKAAENGTSVSTPPVQEEVAQDEGDEFGDFKATENGTFASTPPVQEEVAQAGEDEFGDFGEFEEPDKVVDETSGENEHSEAAKENKDVVSADDEFGDFGDFEEPNEAVKETGDEHETSRPVHVLNENIRAMFQNVFKIDNPVNLENGDGDAKLPFDNPMRTVLAPHEPNNKDKDENQTYKSEQEMEKITQYIQSLPTSPPSTILSEEKWYPYSQYVFHDDGTLYTEKTNLMGIATPSVPEVLSIELPTGFDARAFSPNISSSTNTRKSPPLPPVQATATVVDFPSADAKMTEEDTKEAAEEDEFEKLSAAGKKFMEQLPDLSYMLHPTLSTVK